MNKLIFLSFFSLLISSTQAQHLIINEVSQGTGTSEYVEFVVIGTPTCASPTPGFDLRKVIIDDNNGHFATGSSTGIAPGAVRFANNSFWQNVPQGTIIVIYNESSINTSLPPDDISLNDGNCRLIIPANSTLLEKTTTSPTLTNQNYPPDINWTAGGSWSPLAMANSDDSFQVQNYPVSAAPFHAVSWGNNSNNSIIYFAGTAAAKVFSFTNNSSNDWNLNSNWTSAAVATNQTPGAPNNTANAAWIGSMNPSCSNSPSLTITETLTNESCINACNGSISTTISNGVAPYTYSWSTGATSSALANLCPGTYTLTVTGANGCSESETYTIVAGAALPNAAISAAGPFTNQDPTQQLQALNSGGVWNANCGACLSTSGSFNPQNAGVGSWQVCYTLGSGICTDTQCIVLVVTNGCTPQTTTETITICPGDSILINGNWQSSPGTYAQSFIDVNLCDSTHIAYLNVYNTLNISETLTNESCINACNGAISTTISNGVAPYTYAWSTGATSSALANLCPGIYTLTVTGANGCSESETYTIVAGAALPNAAISAAGPFTNQDPAQQLQALNSGGVWNANCGACLSASGSFNPQIAGVGSWQVCYTLGSGVCADTQCIVLVVTNGCTPQTTSETLTICPGDSILINGNWQSTPGTYAQSFLDVNLCDSTHIAYLNVYNTLNISETIPLCEFDSVWVFNQWIYNTQNVVQTETDANGCSILHTIQVQETSCVTEPAVIYIPNVFTPNGDDVNDTFEIVFQNGLIERGWILNRWGNVIADFSPTQFKWDGTDQRTGLPVLDGVYTYVVYFKPANTVNEIYQGFVVVVR